MKQIAILGIIIFLMVPIAGAQEVAQEMAEPDTGVTIGGEIRGRGLHLSLQHWREVDGKRLPKQSLFY